MVSTDTMVENRQRAPGGDMGAAGDLSPANAMAHASGYPPSLVSSMNLLLPISQRHLVRRITGVRPSSRHRRLCNGMVAADGTGPTNHVKSFGRAGTMEVRLATDPAEIARAQRLRFRVFYEEMAALPNQATRWRRRDIDHFDTVCDHLLVTDTPPGERTRIAGTYRVLRDSVARARGVELYTQGEYDIAPLRSAHADLAFMELGRSCVAADYRHKRTLELLWHGLWTYVREHRVDVMIGCASFEGDDPDRHAEALSLLYQERRAPADWNVRAHDHLYVPMNRVPLGSLDLRAALRKLPPLIKGYLRLGAFVGDGAVLDRQFKTTDVCIILPVSRIDPRYFAHFGMPDEQGSRLSG
jgi:L-ornithine Nalpha-acyltransferase